MNETAYIAGQHHAGLFPRKLVLTGTGQRDRHANDNAPSHAEHIPFTSMAMVMGPVARVVTCVTI
jgi:hypothetical protein